MFFYIAIPAGLLITCCSSRDEIDSPGVAGGIFIALILIVANALPLVYYERLLRNNRCPNCHSLGLKRVSKDVETYTTINTTVYKEKGKSKRYYRDVYNETKYTTYTNYCAKCDTLMAWTDESKNTGVSDTRPKN